MSDPDIRQGFAEKGEEVRIPADKINEYLGSLFKQGRANFQCLRCGLREYRISNRPGNSEILQCRFCRWQLELCVSVFQGRLMSKMPRVLVGYVLSIQNAEGRIVSHELMKVPAEELGGGGEV